MKYVELPVRAIGVNMVCAVYEDGSVFLDGKPYALPAGTVLHGFGRRGITGLIRLYWTQADGAFSVDEAGADRRDEATIGEGEVVRAMPVGAKDGEKPVADA